MKYMVAELQYKAVEVWYEECEKVFVSNLR
jgi:hypothetical protein